MRPTRLALALTLVLATQPARATILWFGGEDTSVTVVGSPGANSTTSTNIRTTFARLGLNVGGGANADPPGLYYQSPTFTAGSTIWFHAQLGTNGNGNVTGTNYELLRFLDGGTCRLMIRGTGTAGQLKITSRNNAATLVDLATSAAGAFTGGTTGPLSIDVQVIYGTSGSVTVYVGGTLTVTFSGDVTTNSATTLNQAQMANWSGNQSYWSEMIIADEDTRSMALVTLIPQAAGNTQGWTPNTLANINKNSIDDTSFVVDPTGNVLSQWTTPTTAPTGTWTVRSVSIESRLQKSTTGPQNVDWSWRIANANYLAGTTTALTNAFANYRRQQDTSPATAAAWAISEVFNTSTNQLNIGVKSLP